MSQDKEKSIMLPPGGTMNLGFRVYLRGGNWFTRLTIRMHLISIESRIEVEPIPEGKPVSAETEIHLEAS